MQRAPIRSQSDTSMNISTSLLLASGSVVDLDGTMLIQWAIFLLFFLILRSIIWKPFLETIERRDEEIEGRKKQAIESEEQAKLREKSYQEQLRQVQTEAMESRALMLDSEKRRASQALDATRGDIARAAAEMRQELERQMMDARARMSSEAEAMARLACERILGRKITS